MQCPRCGNSNNVEKASTIVARETHYSTVTRNVALGDGKYGTTQQGVTSQSERAQALTADAPKEGNGCGGCFLVGMLLMLPLTGCLFSWFGLEFNLAETDIDQKLLVILLLASVLVFIAIIVLSAIVSSQQKNSFNRRYQSWYNMFDRRYYCSNCGNIMQF